ncbi:MAG: ribonuclease Z [Pyrinomonadaceae bacterium]|nr:ribonuclease Z [Pyrinomonadaceae bacterium]
MHKRLIVQHITRAVKGVFAIIGRMKLTVIGSGTSVPHPRRSSSAYWVETDGGSILLDCGASAMHRVAAEGLDWAALDAIWFSHFHLDHVGGLAPLLFGTKYAPETQERTKPMRIFGPKGVRGLLERLSDAGDYRLFKQPFPLEIVEVEPLERFEIISGTTAVAMRTPHTAESLAVHLRDADDRTLVYSADTGFAETFASFARMVDVFVLECSFVRNKPVETHLELAEAMFLIQKARPKRAVLTHLYPEWDAVDFAREISAFGPPCEVIEAVDGLKISI